MESSKEFINRTKEKFSKNLENYNSAKGKDKEKYLKWFPDINRKGKYGFLKEGWTFMEQHNLNQKIFIVERFRRKNIIKPVTHGNLKLGEVEYRVGYYMVGKNGNKIDKWTWGESCPIIPKEDFNKLINLAKKEKTIL